MQNVDIKIRETKNGGDAVRSGNDLQLTGGWGNMVYIAMFGGQTPTPEGRANEEIPSDFWGNSLFHPQSPELQFNSRTEKILNEVSLTSKGRSKIEEAARSDLSFMKDFANVSVSVNIVNERRVSINVTVQEPGNLENKEFQFIWDSMAKELEDVREEIEPDLTVYKDYQVPSTGSGGPVTGISIDFSANNPTPDQYDAINFEAETANNTAIDWIFWDFGDGLTSNELKPTHVFPGGSGAKYTVEVVLVDVNGNVGRKVKTDYIQVQNDKYINEQLSGTQLIISLQNKVDPNQTKWADIRDSSNNNVYTIGYSNDQPDVNQINNNVSGDAHIESFYGTGDTIISTESNASLQLKFLINSLLGEFQTGSINNNHYNLLSNINTQSDSIYAAFLCKGLTTGRQTTFSTDPNSRVRGIETIDNIVNRRPFDFIRAGQTLGTSYLGFSYYVLVEVYGDGNFQTVAVNGVFAFYDSNFGNIQVQNATINALFGQIQSGNQFSEFIISNDPNDGNHYKAYVNDKYGTSF